MYKLNPIKIVNSTKTIKIIEPTKAFKDKITNIKIKTLTDILVKEEDVSASDYFLTLNVNLGSVKLLYYHGDKYLDFEIIELTNTSVKEEELTEEEIRYNNFKRIIQNKMDMPKGTDYEISKHTELLKRTIIDDNARTYVTSIIRKELLNNHDVSVEEVEDLTYRLYSDLYGLGVIQELNDEPSVGEIMINAKTFPKFSCDIYYIQNQLKKKYEKTFRNQQEMENVFRKAVEFSKKELNATDNAMIEATSPKRDRINIIIPEASDNWVLNIRKFSNFVPNMEMMRESGTIDDFNDRLFNVLVRGLCNIGVGGYMGTGKTTLINFLLTYTEPLSRKVVIASINETDIDRVLAGHDVVILNVNDEKGFSFSKHLKFALRSTADRIVVPESRGEEFKQIYEANLKTSGNMFTAHALDDEAFLDMCVEMYKSAPSAQSEDERYIKSKLAKSIDIIIIMRKVGNKIRIKSISEVITENGKFKKLNKLQEWEFDKDNPLVGKYRRTENRLSEALKSKLNENGIPMSELNGL